ncbi:hypothetical protein FB559_6117 [Actinoallomurus bryophytorum]|uniref:Lipoprotein n=1 Tax=Actinoallomurus bryophytorum TaxID=1490222 RepID=A0A543CTI3_9ACTN|nr:hypothetical protein [Actinoallomurus bryophytorum]TQM00404.1 hypothetical protein FB559_6117 [Actinoallomurus bryophytorum]
MHQRPAHDRPAGGALHWTVVAIAAAAVACCLIGLVVSTAYAG